MLIPDEAIITDQAQRLVYVVGKDGTVKEHNVQTGPLVVGLRVIRSGIAPTDRVGARRTRKHSIGCESRGDTRDAEAEGGGHLATIVPLTAPPPAEAQPR